MRRLQGIKVAAVLAAVILLIAILPGAQRYLRSVRPSTSVSASGRSYPITVHDCRGIDVTVAKRPQRIVSLSPAITEILFDIGAGSRVVAVTSYCDFPQQVKKLPKVGGYLDPNVEKVSALSPDLVLLARGTKRDIIDRLSSLGFTVVAVDPTSLDGVLSTIRLIGRVVGEAERADSFAASGYTNSYIQGCPNRILPGLRSTMKTPRLLEPNSNLQYTAEDSHWQTKECTGKQNLKKE
jgi:iron complex transport system substrate-binding protein